MNLKPLGDRVIIKQDEAEETTASGLILTSNSKEKPQRGKVIAVGEGKYDRVFCHALNHLFAQYISDRET